MKKTTIAIRGYSDDFEITLSRKEYLTINQADEYIKKEIIETAQVKSLTHHKEDGSIEIFKNPDYIDPVVSFKGDQAKQYLTNKKE